MVKKNQLTQLQHLLHGRKTEALLQLKQTNKFLVFKDPVIIN